MARISNVNYELVDSIKPGYKEVKVSFVLDGEQAFAFYAIFIKEKRRVDYIKEAEKIFIRDLKSGKVGNVLGKARYQKPIFTVIMVITIIAAITFAALFFWKLFS